MWCEGSRRVDWLPGEVSWLMLKLKKNYWEKLSLFLEGLIFVFFLFGLIFFFFLAGCEMCWTRITVDILYKLFSCFYKAWQSDSKSTSREGIYNILIYPLLLMFVLLVLRLTPTVTDWTLWSNPQGCNAWGDLLTYMGLSDLMKNEFLRENMAGNKYELLCTCFWYMTNGRSVHLGKR